MDEVTYTFVNLPVLTSAHPFNHTIKAWPAAGSLVS